VRLGIFGGSFDPPHVGHLLVVTDAFDALRLDRLIFVPAAVQPLKTAQAAAEASHRFAMVQLLVGDDPRFSVDSIEIDRQGLSYTVETLAAFAERHPRAERFFLVGGCGRVARYGALSRRPSRRTSPSTGCIDRGLKC
jgi:nicotinate-nucleotide adenylyltransferase